MMLIPPTVLSSSVFLELLGAGDFIANASIKKMEICSKAWNVQCYQHAKRLKPVKPDFHDNLNKYKTKMIPTNKSLLKQYPYCRPHIICFDS